jgi:tricorn protease
MPSGYYRFPTIQGDTIIFSCEDDLWSVPATGGIARRLTSGLGGAFNPRISPDGNLVAFTGLEEGAPEVYLMPSQGGQPRRITYLGAPLCNPVGWSREGDVIIASNVHQPFPRHIFLYTVSQNGGQPQKINLGPANSISYGPNGGVVIGRNTGDPARWKRYRGGTAGQIWIDPDGSGAFHTLIQTTSNMANPMWIGERIYLISDREGIGNLYSCLLDGSELIRHTHHNDYYARNASCDGHCIVYHAGGELFVFDSANGKNWMVDVEFHSPQTQRNRKFVDPSRYLDDVSIHPKGVALSITSRGKLFTFSNWEGAVIQVGLNQDELGTAVRYRLPVWLNDGKRGLAVTDLGGEERFVLFSATAINESELFPSLEVGRIVRIEVNPEKDQIAFDNHRNELFCLDLNTKELKKIDQARNSPIAGFCWSPDGNWIAYGLTISLHISVLKIWNATTGESTQITRPVLRDGYPSFDPQGKYLYFLSQRIFDPVYDSVQFDAGFPWGEKPYLITLQKDLLNPFILQPKSLDIKAEKPKDDGKESDEQDKVKPSTEQETGKAEAEKSEEEKKDKKKPLQIDIEGIQDRILGFPIDEGRYGSILGINGGKVLYSTYPVEGSLHQDFPSNEPEAKGLLRQYNFENLEEETIFKNISDFGVARDFETILYTSGRRLRVVKAGQKPDDNSGSTRKSGWINLGRVRLQVNPGAEWRQMFREAWRLQRDHFWTADMSKIDWVLVHDRYLPLVDRVSSRSEFSDLVWEMQGELGTSHSYEFGGDYRPQPVYPIGLLGAEFTYDEEQDGWRISRIARGDAWDEKSDSPLNKPGVNVSIGDVLLMVNGVRLRKDFPPEMALLNLAGSEVILTFAGKLEENKPGEGQAGVPAIKSKEPESVNNSEKSLQEKDESQSETPEKPAPHFVTVKTLGSEFALYYREWVETNRTRVHQATGGKVGYIHIPDMQSWGLSEFHRGFLGEIDREGLIVDVRFNGGGSVSGLLLQKLARKRIGYDTSRWFQDPSPYPSDSVLGSMVALTNEHAGSDGDIFSHGFKLMGLGPLIGTRTWGGVIGIWPRHLLVDGTITTQPEFSFWFKDVGWGVENYGTDPDIVVDNKPQDYVAGVDTQLERAIEEIQKLMITNPPQIPEFGPRPDLSLPRLV